MNPESQEPPSGIGIWFASCTVGLFLLPIAAFIVMPYVFGVEKRDSSAVWGLAGLVPLVAAIFTSPAYFLAQIAAFCFFRTRASQGATLLYSASIGVIIGVIAACLYWQSTGGERILQTH